MTTIRRAKYDKFWLWVDTTIEAYSDAIQMLMDMLTDEQLDEMLAKTGADQDQEDHDSMVESTIDRQIFAEMEDSG